MGSLNAHSQYLASPSVQGFYPLNLDEFRDQAHKTVDFILDYYKSVESYPVLPSVEPGYLRPLLPPAPPLHPLPFHAVLDEISSTIIPGMTHWTSPNFFAYFPATLSSAALCADLLSSALNPVAFSWMASPAVTELETLVLDWLAQLLHLPTCFHFASGDGGGGVVQATTSEAMLCTVVAARDSTMKRLGLNDASRLTAYASDQTHTTFTKACKIAGFAPPNVREIRTHRDSGFSLSPESLKEAMDADVAAGLVPTFLCATVGTTSSTAVDPVGPVADVARQHGAWVHVDAAYAGSACICPEFRPYLDGLEGVDSVSISPHKWLLTCLDCCCLWVRERMRLVKSLNIDSECLRNPATEAGSVVDYKDWQVGVGRRFRSLKLYLVIRCYGVRNLQAHIRSDVGMARKFEQMMASDPRFEVVAPIRFALVCFRLKPDGSRRTDANTLNRKLLVMINESGRAYMTHAVLDGAYVIRLAVGTTMTNQSHVTAAWQLIKEKADELLGSQERRMAGTCTS